jgi:succinate dehydrogenase / fumarate reductase flavoprotein subunit
LAKLDELNERYARCGLSDKTNWTNQNLSFTRALREMLTIARVVATGALLRNECRGAHFKPDFDIKPPSGDDPASMRKEAERWCGDFKKNNDEWLKTTIAEFDTADPAKPKISYEPVDLSSIPPRPRTYGLVGAEVIEEVWSETKKDDSAVGATAAS